MAPPALPFVAAFYAALTGLLCVVLSMLVVRQRMQKRISIGDGGDASLGRMARVFGNFAEYAALVLVLLALVEICGGPRWLVHALGASFIVGRIAHAYGLSMSLGVNPGRAAGVTLTLLTILVASGTLLVLVARKVFV
ncbi:MAG: MAPEG family protein [Reyranella sp.]|jgi:uncharacterized membrane protein YecN with MAPEG domain|nr:MAPEG family protein [Reyranella sp.]